MQRGKPAEIAVEAGLLRKVNSSENERREQNADDECARPASWSLQSDISEGFSAQPNEHPCHRHLQHLDRSSIYETRLHRFRGVSSLGGCFQPKDECNQNDDVDQISNPTRAVSRCGGFDLILCHAANVNRFARGLDRRILTNCLIPDPPKDGLTHSLPLVSASRLNPSMSLTFLWLHSPWRTSACHAVALGEGGSSVLRC